MATPGTGGTSRSRACLRGLTALWYTYIVRCSDQTLYTGITNDLDKRIAAHNTGKGAAYTRARKPVKLVYFQRHRSRSKSLRTEAEFKRLSRAQKEAFLLR